MGVCGGGCGGLYYLQVILYDWSNGHKDFLIIMLKPQDSFGRFVKIFLDLQKMDHTIRKHHY